MEIQKPQVRKGAEIPLFCNMLTKATSPPLNFHILKVRHAITWHVTKTYISMAFSCKAVFCALLGLNIIRTPRKAVISGILLLF